MNPTLVRAEWQRARQALGAAEVLRDTGYLADALSRAYYATLHAAKAALYVHDVATGKPRRRSAHVWSASDSEW